LSIQVEKNPVNPEMKKNSKESQKNPSKLSFKIIQKLSKNYPKIIRKAPENHQKSFNNPEKSLKNILEK